MKRISLMLILLTVALLAPTAGNAQISCSREGLQRAVDLYIAAQTQGDTSGLPLGSGVGLHGERGARRYQQRLD
jgi:hypothetical protein